MKWPAVDIPLLNKLGPGATTVVGVGLALNYWGVIQLLNIPIPHFVDGLYGYLAINAAAIWPFTHFRARQRPAVGKNCPRCSGPLKIDENYSCSNCGTIEFRQIDTLDTKNLD